MLGLFLAILLLLQPTEKVNQIRQSYGLPLEQEYDVLDQVAASRSQDMADRHYFSHYDPQTGEILFVSDLNQLGFNTYAGEILCRATNPDLCWNGWLNSPEHRDALLNPIYLHYGLAESYDGSRYIVTIIFTQDVLY